VDWAIFQAADHAAGVLPHHAATVAVRPMNSMPRGCAPAARVRQAVEFGEDEQILVAGERTIYRDCLRHITDGAATSTASLVMEKPATRASPEEGANNVVSILIVVVLPAPLEPSKPKTSPALTEKGQRVNRRKCAEAASKGL